MALVFLADRDLLHREGIQQFLIALHDALRYSDTPLYRFWREHFYAASQQVAQEVTPLDAVVQTLGQALRDLLQDQDGAQKRHQDLAGKLEYAQMLTGQYQTWLEALRAETSVTNLRAWQKQVAALERDLQKARSENVALERDLVEQRRLVAAREATIAELNAIIAKQHIEFDNLFGAMEGLD